MVKRFWMFAVLIFGVVGLTGCDQFLLGFSVLHPVDNTANENTGGAAQTPIPSHGGLVTDYVSLIDNLRATGAEVVPAEEVSQPFFDVVGQLIRVNGEAVQVFEFADQAAAERAVSQISPDGSSVGTTMITWVAPPHFYRAGKVIVLYAGENENVLSLLESVLGPQIAGQ